MRVSPTVHKRRTPPPPLRPAAADTEENLCPRCDGTGLVYRPACRGGSDHAGYNCGGTICEDEEGPCPDCGDPFGLLEYDAEGV